MTLPTIHLNGTSADMLTEDYLAAANAVQLAVRALCKIEFHGRDYYVQPGDAFAVARVEHQSRLDRLRSVESELLAIASHCALFRK